MCKLYNQTDGSYAEAKPGRKMLDCFTPNLFPCMDLISVSENSEHLDL